MTSRIGILIFAGATLLAAEYTIDGARSTVSFSVRHLMVNDVRGQFSGLKGSVSYDPDNLAASNVEASVEAGSINTGIVKRDAHLRSADFFDTAQFPKVTFKSTSWKRESGRMKVSGELTMHGVTRAVVFDMESQVGETRYPDGTVRTSAKLRGKINRQEFGLKWNRIMEGGGLTVSDDVSITIDIEAIRR